MMKKTILSLLCCCLITCLFGQWSFGIKAGMSPSVNPRTAHIIANRHDASSELLFNVNQVSYDISLGLMVRVDYEPFWFMAEAMYSGSTTEYTMTYIRSLAEPMSMKERDRYLQIPVSIGVRLGLFEVFSGFDAAFNLKHQTGMAQVQGYSEDLSAFHFSWHSGVGINLRNVLFDIRYQQQFSQYGRSRYLNGQELILKNAPGCIVASIGLRF